MPRTKGPFHLKVNMYYRMKSIQNRKLKTDSKGRKKEEIELPRLGGGLGCGEGATKVLLK